jgi:D-glycero-D-manno-heptose 1,7-bisphosphate phosphatase
MIRKRYAILDRDGTIIKECHYLSEPSQVELIPGAAEGIRMLQTMDLGVVAITNQSGVGRGYFSEEKLAEVHDRMNELLAVEGVRLDGIYHCPHLPADVCECRKPSPGMLLQAAKDLSFDPAKSFVVGDKPCDIELGQRVGATTLLVLTGHGMEYVDDPLVGANYVVKDLHAAAQAIRARLTQTALAARLNLARWRAHATLLAAEALDAEANAPAEPRSVPANDETITHYPYLG